MTLLRHRATAGISPHVLFLADGPLRQEVDALGVRTSLVEPGRFREPWRLTLAVERAARMLRRERPDVVLSWFSRAQTVLAPAAALAGMRRRVVLWEHELPDRDVTMVARVAVALPCAWVIADTAAASRANRRLWPHRPGSFVFPGIDPPEPAPAQRVAALRAELGLPTDRPVIGIVGRLIEWKGQRRLIEAVALLRDQGIDVSLLVVGHEAYGVEPGIAERLRALVDVRGLGDRVWLCGHVPEPWAHMGLMDVLVSASEGEPFGLVLLEAMALGTPVLAVESGGPAEIVEDGTSGVLVPSGAPEDLAGGLARLLAELPQRGEALRRAARARFHERFRAERMAADVGRELVGVSDRAARVERADR
jgi:glycosyltransferase involved in cell wall biosynthesis